MANNTTNNDIDPRLEKLLKEELTNRAKKIEVMKQWKLAETDKDSGKSRLKIIYGAVSGIAAVLIVGFFFMHNIFVYDGSPNPESPLSEPVLRGELVNPSIYEAIEAGDTVKASMLIDSSLLECQTRLQQLDSITLSDENQEEIEDARQLIEQEFNELKTLEKQIKK